MMSESLTVSDEALHTKEAFKMQFFISLLSFTFFENWKSVQRQTAENFCAAVCQKIFFLNIPDKHLHKSRSPKTENWENVQW